MAYTILSLDGGGSWALIQARVLQDMYGDIPGHELLKKFDLVIANSGGSLVLACLCHNMKLSETQSIFNDSRIRHRVFSELDFWEKLTPRNFLSFFREHLGIGPKYSTDRKGTGLIEVLKNVEDPRKDAGDPSLIVNTPLDQLPARIGKESLQLLIVGFDYFRQRVSFFRSNPRSNTDRTSREFYRVTLGHAIHASSNAPVNYFDEPAAVPSLLLSKTKKETRKGWYWDGAVAGFNNPVLAGFVEAVTNNAGRPISDYKILSLGTGLARKAVIADYPYSDNPELHAIYEKNKENPLAVSRHEFGFLDDVSKMAKSIVSDPPDSATFIVYAMLQPALDGNANIVRINPCLSPVLNENKEYRILPVYEKEGQAGYSKFMALMELDMDATADNEVALINDLCDKFITGAEPNVPNQLIRGDYKPGNPDAFFLGQPSYQEAKKRWLQILQDENTGSGSDKTTLG